MKVSAQKVKYYAEAKPNIFAVKHPEQGAVTALGCKERHVLDIFSRFLLTPV